MNDELLDAFLSEQPFMSLQPSAEGFYVLEGDFGFSAIHKEHPHVSDSYRLRIVVPEVFPGELPRVSEIGNRIPRLGEFHVNGDGTLCLGSKLSLMARVQIEPTIMGFVRTCIVPYLYAMTLKIDHKIDFVFGELQHGFRGEIDDYKELLGLNEQSQVISALLCILKKTENCEQIALPMPLRKTPGQVRIQCDDSKTP